MFHFAWGSCHAGRTGIRFQNFSPSSCTHTQHFGEVQISIPLITPSLRHAEERRYPASAVWRPGAAGASDLLVLRGRTGSLSRPVLAAWPSQGAACEALMGPLPMASVDPGAACALLAPSLAVARCPGRASGR